MFPSAACARTKMELEQIADGFRANGDGQSATLSRTEQVDRLVQRLWKEIVSPGAEQQSDVSLVACGGYGRRWLFPYSDVDLLFLYSGERAEREYRDRVRSFSQELWDLHLKLSPVSRTLSECERFDPENSEFTISLLDCRGLAGDLALFARLHKNLIPKLVARESKAIRTGLAEVTRRRHTQFGNSIFHLEPNVKDGPGGLRDYNVARWLELIDDMERSGEWPEAGSSAGSLSSTPAKLRQTLSFLMSVRCFLHSKHKRDDNSLTWEAQEEAASRQIGTLETSRDPQGSLTAAERTSRWMRIYFGHTRSIHHACLRSLEQTPAAHPLYAQFQNLRSRVAHPEFSVINGLIHSRQPDALTDADAFLRAFRFQARHGLPLSSAMESQLEQALPVLPADPLDDVEVWDNLQEILLAPHAADALRSMHSLGFLAALLPEFRGIDSLVIRDYSHRYTVDEHTFVAIENLHHLKQPQSKWDQRYSELLDETEQPELLYLALLLHDTGKGVRSEDHVQASLTFAERSLARLRLEPSSSETVLFLIRRHLDMSMALRRDIFDPETIQTLGDKMETPERLKLLCLLTYADIKAVNPEALTPWKAENLWQLYIGTANYLMRSVEQRFHADSDDQTLRQLLKLAPAAGRHLEYFLEGLPKRYLRTHSAEKVLEHMQMAGEIERSPIQIALRRVRHWYELTLVTADRASLFATMTGVLAAWRMNIVKAEAFSNQAGIVVDTFYFTDRFRTLELNLSEWDRFKQDIQDVLCGKRDVQKMVQDRLRSHKASLPKVEVVTRILIDDTSSEHSTLVEVIARDQPGLLHRISSSLAHEECNIEIALIETEGHTAIDVFHLTSNGLKLSPEHQERVKAALLDAAEPH
jgi:[protein-PII] uridylyltransferase